MDWRRISGAFHADASRPPALSPHFPSVKSGILGVGLSLLIAGPLVGQDPSLDYHTIATPHCRVSFTQPLEPVARRVAANAERAYTQLSRELHPPRGTI